MVIIYAYITLFVLSCLLVGLFRRYAIWKNLLDVPNVRSSHVVPTPRGGGIVFILLWLVFAAWAYWLGDITPHILRLLIPSAFLISMIGCCDDHYNVPAHYRFLIQLIAVGMSFAFLGGFPDIMLGWRSFHCGWFGTVIAFIAVVWSVNLYNFMDGIDGIAAVEALFVFGVGGYFVWQAQGHELAVLIWAVAVIVAGFFVWNRPPAKIFMGDVGSGFLGFLVAIFAIIGEVYYKVPVLLWVMLYGVFWLDATITLLRRMRRKEVWYQAHRSHAYQRLQLENWSHARILGGVIVLNIVLAMFAMLGYYFPRYLLLLLLFSVAMLTMVYVAVEKLQPM